MVIINCLNHCILRVAYDSKTLAILTRFVLKPPELSLIMHQQVNIDSDSSLTKNLVVHVASIPSNQDNTFFMIARGLTNIGIHVEILLFILLCFLNIAIIHLLSQMTLLSLLWAYLIVNNYIFLLLFYI